MILPIENGDGEEGKQQGGAEDYPKFRVTRVRQWQEDCGRYSRRGWRYRLFRVNQTEGPTLQTQNMDGNYVINSSR